MCPTCCESVRQSLAGKQVRRFLLATVFGSGAGLVAATIWFLVRRLANLQAGLIAVLVGFMVGAAVRKGSGGWGGLRYQVLAVLLTYGSIAANYIPDIIEAILQAHVVQPPAAVAKADRAPAALPAAADEPVKDAMPVTDESPPEGAVGEKPQADDRGPQPEALPDAAAAPEAPAKLSGAEKLAALAMLAFLVCKLALIIPFAGLPENLIGLLIVGFALWEAWKINARRLPPIMGPYQINPSPAG
jgi:hypothetical protein